jgi:hypothetical protein
MNGADHRAQAEQLLEQARSEQDSTRRHLILAEAQVHATLAPSAPPGTNPPGRDDRPQPETSTAPSTAEDSTGGHWEREIADQLEARSWAATSDSPPLDADPQ